VAEKTSDSTGTAHAAEGSGLTQPSAGAGALENHLGGEEARNYRRYERDVIAPHVGRSMLEIGSGLGDFSAQFLPRLARLVVSDSDPYCIEQLSKRYEGDPSVQVLELILPADIPVSEPVDTVVAMNVLEHIVDDAEALRCLARATKPGGKIVLWVPGYPQLYGDFDRKVGHVRRYTPKTMAAAVTAAGLSIEVLRPINMLGGIAWWFAVRRAGVGYPNPRIVRVYDRLVVPTTRLIERIIRPPFGQTVFCVARVPEHYEGR
jgi:SAM-dependent methyltransferase